MRPTRTPRLLVAVLAAAALAASASAAVAGGEASPNEVLSIEGVQGAIQIRGRGILNMRVAQGSVQIVDQSPSDQFSPRVGGIPRGKAYKTSGTDLSILILGGRYKIVVRGTGISVSARGDGTVVVLGEPDPNGAAGTIRIGDTVRQIPTGESKASFGGGPSGPSGPFGESGPTSGSSRDEKKS
jgi:hypothetical protein